MPKFNSKNLVLVHQSTVLLRVFNFNLTYYFLITGFDIQLAIKSFLKRNITEQEQSACTEMLTVNDFSNAISPNGLSLWIDSLPEKELCLLFVSCNVHSEEDRILNQKS